MKVNRVKWINLFLVVCVLAGYQQYAYANREKVVKDEKVVTNKWKDGFYKGKAKGFGGDIQVKVTIKNQKILKVEIISADKETPDYLSRASKVINEIEGRQDTNVDVVSGATYSSNGIINAVKQALEEAYEEN